MQSKTSWPSRLNVMAFCPEHPKWDQNPNFTPLNETTSIPYVEHSISGLPPFATWPFITDEVFYYSWVSVTKKHLKIKDTCNYYFKTIGYCSITKVKSSLIKKVLCNLALATNAWFKMLLLIWTLLCSGPSCYVHSCALYKRCPFNHGACLN